MSKPTLQKLPETHTDFLFSVEWDPAAWIWLFLAVAVVGAVLAVLLYRRRRRH